MSEVKEKKKTTGIKLGAPLYRDAPTKSLSRLLLRQGSIGHGLFDDHSVIRTHELPRVPGRGRWYSYTTL